jgi:serine/threonine protein kinase, bacterial
MNAGGGLGASASPLGDRYTVVRELGQGGFGRTYLVRDRQRNEELCVIKEFAAQVNDEAMLAKAKELFEREANVLYQLDHEQIPKFRQLPKSDTSERLYIVQDYVQGPTYQALLEDRQQFGGKFSETEITQLLYQLLPVLSYIHSMGVIHRDISPDNLILRQTDGLPVLIDFGSVKNIAASVGSLLAAEGSQQSGAPNEAPNEVPAPTRIGKVGYASPEQMRTGEANPASDLYALAATLLALATGAAPQGNDLTGDTLRGYESLSPKLAQILKQMLSANPTERLPSAEAVLDALQADDPPSDAPSSDALPSDELGGAMYGGAGSLPQDGLGQGAGNAFNLYSLTGLGMAGAAGMSGAAGNQNLDYEDGQVLSITDPEVMPAEPMRAMGYVDSAANESEVYEPEIGSSGSESSQLGAKQALIGLLLTLGLVSTLLLLYALARGSRAPADGGQQAVTESLNQGGIEGEYSFEETARRQTIRSRREAQGISEAYFQNLIDQLFYQEYPMLLTSGPNGGRKVLTSAPEDEPLRIRWDNIATRVLDTLDDGFSSNSLGNLGTYSEASRDRWRSLITPANVSDRALNDLVDAKFFTLFPNQSGRDFLAQPVGQLYYALAEDIAQGVSSGGVTETLSFAEGAFSKDASGQLSPGEGRIYLMSLSAGQSLRLNLNAPPDSTQLSLYLPEQTDDNPDVFADSEQTTWSGALTQTGLYEGVIVNRSNEIIDYDLAVSVDKITSVPVAPPKKPVEKPAEATGQSTSGQNTQVPNGSANTPNSAASPTETQLKTESSGTRTQPTTSPPAMGEVRR